MSPRGGTVGAALVVLLAAACDRRPPPPAPVADATIAVSGGGSESGAVATLDASSARSTAGTDPCGRSDAKIRAAKSIGHTSIVYKLELDDGTRYAFKPNAKKMKDRWRGEVAAYRLGRALGISNVPPACPRAYSTAELGAVLGASAVEELIVTPGEAGTGVVDGAVIPWIQGLQFLPLEKEPLRSEARAWLRDPARAIPEGKVDLAAQISTLVVFDAITTNWDRYSGANVGLDATGKRVLFIDNDAAFMTLPPERMRENQDALRQTERFSRSLFATLKTLADDARLGDAFGSGLLAPAAIAAVRQRIEAAVKLIDEKIAKRSEADVLAFP